MATPSGYKFPILNSDGSYSTTIVDMTDMFVRKELFLSAGLWCWGLPDNGQNGNNQIFPSISSPNQVGTLSNWKQVNSGNSSTTSIRTDGTLWTFGRNNSGQLGNGTIISYSSPIQIGLMSNWKQISCGYGHTTAIKTDGTLWAWGNNTSGQLGNGTTTNYSSPIQVGSLTTWKQASAGGYFNSAIKTDGTLWAWGNNTYGQLSYSVYVYGTNNFSSPVQVSTATQWSTVDPNIQILTQGGLGASAAAISTTGQLWTWGTNGVFGSGQLGNGTTASYSSPIQIGTLTNWKQISMGSDHTGAIKTDGTLWTWGGDSYGQLGNGTFTKYSSPIQIGALTNWKQVSCGRYITAAIKTDGTLWTCGYNSKGQLGNGNITTYNSPIQVGTSTNWSQVSCGRLHTAAVKTDGTLWTCGYNSFGQLGNGNQTNQSIFTQIGTLTDWKQVACGYLNTVAVKTNGTLWAWGYGANGTNGNNSTSSYSSPVQVGTLTNWKQVAIGYEQFSAIKTDGTLWTCGYNTVGQLGNGTSGINYSSPIQIGTSTSWSQVFCGGNSTYAYSTNGTLWAFGDGSSGQLGYSAQISTQNTSSPIQIGSLTNWKQVSSGNTHISTVKSDGTLWTWGNNSNGQLGNGTIVIYSSPIQIGSLTNWKQVSSGQSHTAAIKTDGTLWVWGNNNQITVGGALGNGTTVSYSSPIQVGSLTNWKQVSCGQYHTAAIKTDGTLWTWGVNILAGLGGALGNGTTVSYSSPIQVGALTNWKQVSCGYSLNTSAIASPDLP